MINLGEQQIKIHLWDTAGQEKHFSLAKNYFQKADGVVIVFDITDMDSFRKIQEYWMNQVKQKSEERVKKILVGNQADMIDVKIKSNEKSARRIFQIPYFFNIHSCLIGVFPLCLLFLHQDRKIKYADGYELAQKYDMQYFQTSAQTGDQVHDAFQQITRLCVNSIQSDPKPDFFPLQPNPQPNQNQNGSCLTQFFNLFKTNNQPNQNNGSSGNSSPMTPNTIKSTDQQEVTITTQNPEVISTFVDKSQAKK